MTHDGTRPVAYDAAEALVKAEAYLAAQCARCGHHRTLHPDDGPCSVAACADRCHGYQRKETLP